ncbi:MAG: phosphoribosylanthranilate isomerase [Methanomicrobiaceae archaeon]|nr:phosphoribosylanthranilate isomerase [Methanomicrobiaceae archaeon]
MRVKICGITRPEDARRAEAAGADAIGVVLFSTSPRSVSPERANAVFAAVGPFTTTVAVTHTDSEEHLAAILALRPDAVQLMRDLAVPDDAHVRMLRALAPGDPVRDDCDAVIIDGSHGTGTVFDPDYARFVVRHSRVPVILAGGLTPGTVAAAIESIDPYAVDVASGVEERPGIKDEEKIRAFMRACRERQHG